jgi:hypothetical protein
MENIMQPIWRLQSDFMVCGTGYAAYVIPDICGQFTQVVRYLLRDDIQCIYKHVGCFYDEQKTKFYIILVSFSADNEHCI